MGRTVNPLAEAYEGSNPSLPTWLLCWLINLGYSVRICSLRFVKLRRAREFEDMAQTSGSSSVGRASAFQAEGRESESRLPLCPGEK
jgi:hypothetical protein